MPEIVQRNIERVSGASLDKAMKKAMDDDKRHAFDIASDSLLRITIIRTGDGEYAVLLTESVLIAGAWSMHEVIARTTRARALSPENMAGVRLADPGEAPSAATRAYWQSVLKDLPPVPLLRGYKPVTKRIEPARHRIEIASRDWALLQEKANGNKHMLIAILHTAWGLLLQYMSGFPGTYYCLLMPDPCARLRNSAATAGTVSSVVVRLACKEGQAVRAIMGQQFRQMLASTSFSCTRMKDIRKDYRDLFNHFLSFHDFSLDSMSYADVEGTPDGRVADLHCWDVQAMDLGVYFYHEKAALSLVFLYNQANFAFHAVERLAKNYETVLRSFLMCWDEPLARFEARLDQHILDVRGSKQEAGSRQQEMLDFLAGTGLLQGLSEEARDALLDVIQEKSCSEYEIIPDTPDSLLVLREGIVARCVDHGASVTPMDVIKEGGWLNENALATGSGTRLLLQVVSEKARIISIPISAIQGEQTLLKSLTARADRIVAEYPAPLMYAAW